MEGAIPEADARPWLFDKHHRKDETPWKEDPEKTEYAQELVQVQPLKDTDDANAKAACDVGLRIYRMKTCLLNSETRNPMLFARKHARDVWNEVINRDFEKAAVIGSPGIGKSFSSAYYLKRLLEKGKLVVYEARQNDKVYVFVPPGMDNHNEQYVTHSVHVKDWRAVDCPVLKNQNNYYYVDPDKAETSERIPQVLAHTTVGPSLEPGHLGEWRKKNAEIFYMGAWTYEEVLAVRPYMPVEGAVLSESDVQEAFWGYGGIVRHIFATIANKGDATEKANRVLQDEQLVKGIYKTGVEFLGTKDRSKPPSALFTIVPVCSLVESDVYKDKPGSFRPFAEARVSVVSEWARAALVDQYWKDVETTVACKSHEVAAMVGWLFEDASHITLASGGSFERRYLDGKKASDELKLPKRPLKRIAGSFAEFLAQVQASKGARYLQPQNPKMPVLDAAEGSSKELYQITLNAEHNLSHDGLVEATKQLRATSKKKLVLNWVVPGILYPHFKRRHILEELAKKVEQRVIKLTPNRPALEFKAAGGVVESKGKTAKKVAMKKAMKVDMRKAKKATK